MKLILAFLSLTLATLAGKPASHAASAPIVVTGPAVTTQVTIAGATGPDVVLTFPVVAGNFSSAVLSLHVVADTDIFTGSVLFFDPVVGNADGTLGSVYLTNTPHADGTDNWTYNHKTGVKALQDGSVTVSFAPYARNGETITATITPTVTFTK